MQAELLTAYQIGSFAVSSSQGPISDHWGTESYTDWILGDHSKPSRDAIDVTCLPLQEYKTSGREAFFDVPSTVPSVVVKSVVNITQEYLVKMRRSLNGNFFLITKTEKLVQAAILFYAGSSLQVVKY